VNINKYKNTYKTRCLFYWQHGTWRHVGHLREWNVYVSHFSFGIRESVHTFAESTANQLTIQYCGLQCN